MRGSFTARTTLSIAAWDAGGEIETEMVVKFTVQPGCAETRTDPASPALVEDISIRLFTPKTTTELPCPSWLQEHFSDDESFQDWLLSEAAEQDECAREDAAERRYEQQREDRA